MVSRPQGYFLDLYNMVVHFAGDEAFLDLKGTS